MRWIKRFFIGVVALLVVAIIALVATGNKHVLNGVTKTYLIGKARPDIDDRTYFDTREIRADKPEAWPMANNYNLPVIPKSYLPLIDSLETTAFLVFKNDSLLYERYWEDYDEKTLSNSFSMAKSFCAMLIGKAIDEGYIQSLDQRVGDFIPSYNEGKNASLTIRQLLEMTSGIPFGESYTGPFGYMAKAYYGDNLIEETMKYKVEKDPGTLWVYEGGNTVLLGMIVQKATGRNVSDYFFQKFWSCVGAEHNAFWNLDSYNGMEKTFSGFYATARDYARIGKLFKQNGIWGKDTLLSPAFVQASLTPNKVPDDKGEPCTWYGLHWWLGEHNEKPFFSCRGMRGQYIAVIPDENIIVVRLGHQNRKERVAHMPPDLHTYLDIALDIAHQ